MNTDILDRDLYLTPEEAARKVGCNAKRVRLLMQRGRVRSVETGCGWLVYYPDLLAYHRAHRKRMVWRAVLVSMAMGILVVAYRGPIKEETMASLVLLITFALGVAAGILVGQILAALIEDRMNEE